MAQNPQQTSNTVDYSYQNIYQNSQYYQQYQYYNSYAYPPPLSVPSTQLPPPPPPIIPTKVENSTPPPPGVENYNSSQQQSSPQNTIPTVSQAQNYSSPYYSLYQYPYYTQPPNTVQTTTTTATTTQPPLYRNPYTTSQPVSYTPKPPSVYSPQPPSYPPQPPPYPPQPQPPSYPPKPQSPNKNNQNLSNMPSISSTNSNINNLSFKLSNKKNIKKEIAGSTKDSNSYNQIKFTLNNSKGDNSFTPAYIPVKAIPLRKETNNSEEEAKAKENSEKEMEKKEKKDGNVYPESLQKYITRMFNICPPKKMNILENELKKMIADAKMRNALNTIKWENMGLPSKCYDETTTEKSLELLQISKKKRKRNNLNNITSSPFSSSSPIELDELLIKLPEKERMEEIRRREKRAKRFHDDYSEELKKKKEKEYLQQQAEITKQIYISQNGNPDVVDWDQDTLVGTCQDLEKNYLRLTSAPDPATVRPLPVLRKTLELLKEKWKKEQNYNYICDQFKSLRQDLTVQRIKNDFAVQVYEIHARIALEKGDLGEYNQCQSQLKQLYNLGFNGNVMEFTAYRLLYYLHTLNPKDINETISELTKEQKEHEFIKHALDVRSAVANGNYHKLFQLYINPPANMACYLMDHFVDRERIKALKIMTKAYLNLNIDFLTDELGFDSVNDCLALLKSVNCPIRRGENKQYYIPCKEAYPSLNRKWLELAKRGIDIKGQI